jgi:hypothetical protein
VQAGNSYSAAVTGREVGSVQWGLYLPAQPATQVIRSLDFGLVVLASWVPIVRPRQAETVIEVEKVLAVREL